MALAKTRQDQTAARLETLSLPDGAPWARDARNDALSRLTVMGLPERRDEYWKFTNPARLLTADPTPATSLVADEERVFSGIDALRIVFVDGVFDPAQSDDLAGENLEILRLADAAQPDIHWAKDLYGALETRGQTPVPRPFAALNTAFATDGVMIRATGVVTRPVNLVYLHVTASSDVILHHCIRVDAGASLTVLENGPAAARFNKCMEVEVADDATFHHIRTQGRDHDRQAITHAFARLGNRSTYKSFTLTVNGVLTRNEHVIEMVGDESAAHVAGAAAGDGAFHHDDTVFVTHTGRDCESRQVFKKVLRNGAVGVFQGKILVNPGAQKTDGYQISQSLLLDDDSQFLAKPELEIYADDVACSHGSTTGAIDEDALFYLQSRGVPKAAATDLMVLSFLAQAIDEIADEALRDDILARLEAWLSRRRT